MDEGCEVGRGRRSASRWWSVVAACSAALSLVAIGAVPATAQAQTTTACGSPASGSTGPVAVPLARGAQGVAVQEWQELLNRWLAVRDPAGAFRLAVDGDFGPLTDAVTRELQVETGRAVDGIVGPATLAGYRATGVDGRGDAALARGSCGTAVAAWQTRLNRWSTSAAPGADELPIAVDGVFGPATERATAVFQSQSGLAADGIVGPATLAAMTAAETRLGSTALPRDLTTGTDASAPSAAPAPPATPATPAPSTAAVPAAGICPAAQDDPVVVTLAPDVATPRCAIVTRGQHLVVVNRMGVTAHISWAGGDRVVPAGEQTTFAAPFGQYLDPGIATVVVDEYHGSGPQLLLQPVGSG